MLKQQQLINAMNDAPFHGEASPTPIFRLNLYHSEAFCDIETDSFKFAKTGPDDNSGKTCILCTFTMRALGNDRTIEPVKHAAEDADLMETMSNLVGRMSEGYWSYINGRELQWDTLLIR
jgi:hypothetical protein